MQEKSDISSVRRSNFLAVSGYLRRRESATIPQLAEETGLSLPTVTRAINSGITLRILTSCGICDSDRGRKAVSYAINPDFMHCAVLYFFSDTLHFEVFDFCFKRLFEYKCEINDDNALETLDFAVRKSMTADPLIGFYAFGVPGHVLDNMIVRSWRFPSLEGIDLKERFAEMTGKLILIENNMRAAVTGAKMYLPDFDSETVAAYTYGTKKYGLGVSVNGDILKGARGKAGDIGKIFTPMADRQNLEFYSYQLRAIISVLDPDRIVLYPTDDGCTFDMLADKAAECFGEEIRSRFVRNCDLYTDCLNGLLWLVNDELKTTFE